MLNDENLKHGRAAQRYGDHEKAITFFKYILDAEPDHIQANYHAGISFFLQGRREEAVLFFKRAFEEQSDSYIYCVSLLLLFFDLNNESEATGVFTTFRKAGLRDKNFIRSHFFSTDQIEYDRELLKKEIFRLSKHAKDNDDLDQAIGLLQIAIMVFADCIDLLCLLINCLILNNDLVLAEDYISRAKRINFEHSGIIWNEVRLLVKRKKLKDALQLCESVRPNVLVEAEGLGVFGLVLRLNNRLDESLKYLDQAIDLDPKYADAYTNRALIQMQKGNASSALLDFERAYKIKPRMKQIWPLLSKLYLDEKKFSEAVTLYEQLLEEAPDNVNYRVALGYCKYASGDHLSAIEMYKLALDVNPNNAEILNNMGVAYQALDKFEAAIHCYEKAIQISPEYTQAIKNLAMVFSYIGKFDDVILLYKKCISIDPKDTEAYRRLSQLINYGDDNVQFTNLKSLINENNLDSDQQIDLYFALAKAHESICDIGQAFKYYSIANNLMSEKIPYSFEADKNRFDDALSMHAFCEEKSKSLDFSKLQSVNIIFIVGMPRSGTTLIEQVLNSHSKILGCGEIQKMADIALFIRQKNFNMSNRDLIQLLREYQAELIKTESNSEILVDKLPHNFLNLPLIKLFFPNAKILHVTRDAAATCWSNYKTSFISKNLSYSCSLINTVEHYNLYKDLMLTWETLYPNILININYDEMVNNWENGVKSLLDQLKLDFEEKCLYPSRNATIIKTASLNQVRKDIYKDSSQDWKKYESYIQPTFDKLS